MEFIDTGKAAKRWGLSERRVRELCQGGRVEGAVRIGGRWLVPSGVEKPRRGAKAPQRSAERLELYLNPVFCDGARDNTYADEERALCCASDLTLRGDFEEATQILEGTAESGANDAYLLVTQMMLYLVRTMGDPDAGKAEAALAEAEAIVARNSDFCHARTLVGCIRGKGMTPVELMGVPSRFAPLFAVTVITGSVMDALSNHREIDTSCLELLVNMVDEIGQPGLALYVHAALAHYYSLLNEQTSREHHVQKALEIALPHKWYTPLADYSLALDWYEARNADPKAYGRIFALSGAIMGNYVRTGHFGKSSQGLGSLDADELRVAFMNARGMSLRDIASALGTTVYGARKTLLGAYEKVGAGSRDELKTSLSELCRLI